MDPDFLDDFQAWLISRLWRFDRTEGMLPGVIISFCSSCAVVCSAQKKVEQVKAAAVSLPLILAASPALALVCPFLPAVWDPPKNV